MKVLFIGCVKSSEIFLHRLIDIKADIVGVVTKQESKFNSDFVDIGSICRDYGLDYMYVDSANSSEAKAYMRSKTPDLILCMGWSQLLDEEVLSIPRVGGIGFHPAALPHNRGRHPLIWALALGMKETASTLFLMDTSADTGKIISQKLINIDYDDNAGTLYEKVMQTALVQMEEVLNDFQSNTLNITEQDLKSGNTWRKRSKEDGRIDWRMSSKSIYNLVRALTYPYVGAHFVYKDEEYKVWRVREIKCDGYENIEPGKVVQVYSGRNFTVKVGDHLIEILDCDEIDIEVGDYL